MYNLIYNIRRGMQIKTAHMTLFVYLYGWQKKSQSLTHFIAETVKTLLHISFGNINWYNP